MKTAEWWLPEMQQEVFRKVLDGFSRPGKIMSIGSQSADAVLMLLVSLLDESVTLADTIGYMSDDQRRLLLAPDAHPAQARFVLSDGRLAPSSGFQPALGTLESPELGATLILMVGDLSVPALPDSCALHLRGPGIKNEQTIHVTGLHPDWLARRNDWVAAYPLGVDMVLCAKDRMVALPRTTQIEIQKEQAWAM